MSRESEAEAIRDKIRTLQTYSRRAEVADAGVTTELWALLEEIEKAVCASFEVAVYAVEPEKLAAMRDKVAGARGVMAEIRGYVGKRGEYLKEIDRLRKCLEDGQNAGRIKAVEVP